MEPWNHLTEIGLRRFVVGNGESWERVEAGAFQDAHLACNPQPGSVNRNHQGHHHHEQEQDDDAEHDDDGDDLRAVHALLLGHGLAVLA